MCVCMSSLLLCADWEGGEGGEGEEEGRPGDAVDAVGVLSEGVEAKQLLQLMKEKDMRGHTPFMAAVACKVGHVLQLMHTTLQLMPPRRTELL